jgi:uncharacterized damage-inducible protein DinB
MSFSYLESQIKRHLDETRQLVAQLHDDFLSDEPVKNGRPLIEVFLHIIRSLEYYSKGLAKNVWESAPYFIQDYNTARKVKKLYEKVSSEVLSRIKELSPGNEVETLTFNRKATKLEILQEMLEHSITHRGQIQVYYRLVGIEPAKISYII